MAFFCCGGCRLKKPSAIREAYRRQPHSLTRFNSCAGTVKLTDVGQRNSEALALISFNLSDFAPCPHSERPHFAEFRGWHFVAWELEQIGYWIVNGEKSLQLGRRFELLQGSLSLPCRLMRVLRPIVQTFVRSMFDAGQDFPFCRCV